MDKSVRQNNFKTEKKGIKSNSVFEKYAQYILSAIVLLTAFTFANAIKNDFVSTWDDQEYIINNDLIKHFSWNSIRLMFSTFFHGNYHPLVFLFYSIVYHFAGLSPKAFHFISLVMHLSNVVLVFVFVKRLSGKIEVATIVALFFGIHPMHVESVAWVSETKDVLYTFFFLLGLIAYLKHKERISKRRFPFLVLLYFILSVLSKPAAACFPLVLTLIDYYKDKKSIVENIVFKIPFLLLAVFFGALALFSQTATGAVQDIAPLYSFIDRIFLVSYSIVYYMVKAVLPFGLCALHYYPLKSGGLLPIQYYLALPVLLLLVFAVHRSRGFKKELIFGLLFYLVTIVMVLQIVPFGRAIVSERYSYVPYLGLFFILGQFVSQLRSGLISLNKTAIKTIHILIPLMVITFTFQVWQRNKIWQNGITLFSDVVQQYPEETFGWDALAESRNRGGDHDGALLAFNKAIELNPSNPQTYFDRAVFFIETGKPDEAIIDCNKAIELKSDYYQAFCNRGLCLLNLKRFDECLKDFDKAIQLNPEFADAWFNRGNAFFEINKFDRSIENYSAAIKLRPEYVNAFFNRGIARIQTNDNNGACLDFNNAKKLGHTKAQAALDLYCR